ncbi:MAG: YedE-related selenium metabolism membrane protein [Clostridia bacterium]|nr:YedE-related selenium metabolism membrane protein [Clostridia bacterium]
MENKKGIIIAGAVIGLMSALLVKMGNPANMGVCIACFIRDIAGALGMHRAAVVQYIRPEVIGIVLGSFIMSIGFKEFKSTGGSSPFTRFFLGALVMIGALIFLGCPLRMVLRMAGGDLNAIVGLAGFAVGIVIGIFFLNKGFSLKRSYTQSPIDGYVFPGAMVGLLVLLLVAPAFIFFSESGPGSMAAPVMLSLGVGLIAGALAQRTRLCMVGGIRDVVMFKDTYLISGFLALFVAALVGNMAFGSFSLGFEGQPIAHSDALWNFLGMTLAGWGSVLLGGCPLRQLILAGEGSSDSAVAVAGMLVGAAFAHNFGLAASPNGVPANGKVAAMILFAVVAIISVVNSDLLQASDVKKGAAQNA